MPRPTLLGFKAALFYAVLVGVFFAAAYANLFFLLLVFASLLALSSYLATWRNFAGVTGALEPPAPMPAGRAALRA